MDHLQIFRVSYGPEGVARVAFDMPGRRYNVLTEQFFAELQAVIDHLADSPAAGCAVFYSAKESGFVAGADLKEIGALPDPERATGFVALGQQVFDGLEALAIPTIAVIHGPCLGGGLEFALACRYRVACDDAPTRLGTPEVKLGLLPVWGGIQRLPERIGLEAALPMLWTGRAVSARQALEMGLVDAIWPPEQFRAGVQEFVAAVVNGSRTTPIETRSVSEATAIGPRLRFGLLSDQTAVPNVLDAVHARLNRGRHAPPPAAMLEVLEQWRQGGHTAASAQERRMFPKLLFSEHCRRRLSRFFNRSRTPQRKPWVDGLTIGAVLRRTASQFADRDAAVFIHAATRLTWAEMDRKVDCVARGLLALGLRRGDHFGVWSTNWPEWVYLQYAAARAGIVLVTVNPSFQVAELRYTLAQSEVRGLALIERHRGTAYFDLLREVCPELDSARPGALRSQRLPKLRWVVRIRGAAHPGMIAWDNLEAAGEALAVAALEEAEAACRPDDPINLQYTSGTTGLPKGALLSHRNLLMNAFYTAQRQRLGQADRVCLPVPLYHCFGCVLGTLCTLVSGAAMVFPQPGTERNGRQGRHEPATDLRKANPQVFGRDDEVAAGHQAGAAGIGRTVDGGNGDQGEIGQGLKGAGDGQDAAFGQRGVRRFNEIQAGAKGGARAAENQDAELLLCGEGFHCRAQRFQQLDRQRVAALGAIEGEDCRCLVQLLDDQDVVVHGSSSGICKRTCPSALPCTSMRRVLARIPWMMKFSAARFGTS